MLKGYKAPLPLELHTEHMKGRTQAGKEEPENKDMGTVILDLTTGVLSSTQASGSLEKRG